MASASRACGGSAQRADALGSLMVPAAALLDAAMVAGLSVVANAEVRKPASGQDARLTLGGGLLVARSGTHE